MPTTTPQASTVPFSSSREASPLPSADPANAQSRRRTLLLSRPENCIPARLPSKSSVPEAAGLAREPYGTADLGDRDRHRTSWTHDIVGGVTEGQVPDQSPARLAAGGGGPAGP